MDAQILVVLFLLFSILSSIINKIQERRGQKLDETKLERRDTPPTRRDPFDDEEVLPDWEVLFPSSKREPEPPEFQEVVPKRDVQEPAQPKPEFQNVQGKREVLEPVETKPEFREVEGKRDVQEPTPIRPEYRPAGYTPPVSVLRPSTQTPVPAEARFMKPKPTRRKRSGKLLFSPQTVRQAIVYNEILGPPRAENMP